MLDDLRKIAIFAKAIHHGSFRGAAAELNLSPSVVSHHIGQLEERLGVALIYRSTRRLTLTKEGETLLVSARAMLEAAETGLNDIMDQSSKPAGELRVTLPSVLASSPLMPAIVAFRARYPDIRLTLEFSDARHSLVNEGFDLAIRASPQRDRAPNRVSLFHSARHLVAAKHYLAQHPPISHPDDLQQHHWIDFLPTRGVKTVLRHASGKSAQIKPDTALSTNDAYAAYQLAFAGAGIASVPDFLARDNLKTGDLVIVLPDWSLGSIETFAQWPTNAPRDGITRLFVSDLQLTLQTGPKTDKPL